MVGPPDAVRPAEQEATDDQQHDGEGHARYRSALTA
jgi:hypothetical protein